MLTIFCRGVTLVAVPVPDTGGGAASAAATSSARDVRLVSGRYVCLMACAALSSASHSSAMPVARAGLEAGMRKTDLVLVRTGRVSR